MTHLTACRGRLLRCWHSLGPLEGGHHGEVIGVTLILGIGHVLTRALPGISAGIATVLLLPHHTIVAYV